MTVRTPAQLVENLANYKTLLEIEPWKITDLVETFQDFFGASYASSGVFQTLTALNNGNILAVVDVSLIAAAQTTLYTVPTGKALIVTQLQILGKTVSTGSTKTSTLKIGTTAGSYAELLNGATGMVQATATASSLLADGAVLDVNGFYPPANVAAAGVSKFAAATVLKADVSTAGALPTTGAVTVIVRGCLV